MLHDEDVETLARKTHLLDAAARGADAVAWSDLSAAVREANRDSARFAPLLLTALGLSIVSGAADRHRDALTPEELDAGARLEHLRWCRFTRSSGQVDHPDLVTWDELDEPTRELDRLRVRALPALLIDIGYSVVDAD